LMKQLRSSCPSLPDPSGAQYVHVLPFYSPWFLWEVSAGGGYYRAGLGGGGAASVGVINKAWVSLSLAIATTSAQMRVDPWRVTFVLLTCSNSPCISRSKRGIKQCRVASSFAAIDLRSYSTRRTKLAALSYASGLSAKYFALNWLADKPNSFPTSPLKSSQLVKMWCW
jgi:hypothetical protein